jgi:transposase-like protein
VDESYVKVGGGWRYLFRAIDQYGQVIGVVLSPRRDANAARRIFARAIADTQISPIEVTTDQYRLYPRVIDEMLPAALHRTQVYANNAIETDHGPARVIVAGHASCKNLRRGSCDLGTDAPAGSRVADAFAELALVI